MSVLLYHAAVFAPPHSHESLTHVLGVGWAGVDVFFAISGFILYLPFARAGYGGGQVALRSYFDRRARRILPAYFFNLLALTTLAAAALLVSKHGLLVVLANATFSAGYADTTLINGVYWTLFCEVAFYAVLPILARLFIRTRWIIGFPLVVTASTSYKLAIIYIYAGTRHAQLSHALEQFPAVLDQFAIGMLAATVWVALERKSAIVGPRLGIAVAISGFALILTVLYALQRGIGPTAYWSGESTLGWLPLIYFKPALSLGASLVILGVCYSHNLATSLLESRPFRYLGLVSYGVYLWHLPLIRKVAPSLPSSHGDLVRYMLCVGVAGALALAWASVSYYFVERPWLTRQQRVERRGVRPDGCKDPDGEADVAKWGTASALATSPRREASIDGAQGPIA